MCEHVQSADIILNVATLQQRQREQIHCCDSSTGSFCDFKCICLLDILRVQACRFSFASTSSFLDGDSWSHRLRRSNNFAGGNSLEPVDSNFVMLAA